MMSREVVSLWRFLGDISIPGPNGELTPHLGKKPIALLAYLALARAGAGRDELAALLWPDPDPSRSRHNLRQCILSLRMVFDGGLDKFLEISDDRLALNHAAVEVDARRLLEIDAGKVTPAGELLDLCRGPFMRGLTTRAQPFDDWASAQRDRLTEAAGRVLGSARAEAERAGRKSEAMRLTAALADLEVGSAIEPAAKMRLAVVPPQPRRERWLRNAALVLGGAAVAVGILFGAYYTFPGFRGWVDEVVQVKSGPPRIAVLPFTTANGNAEEANLAGGVTLGVVYGLYAITAKELFVVTMLSPPQKLSTDELKRIAKDLDVHYLITAAVAVDGDTIRIDAQRLDFESSAGDIIWRKKFSKPRSQAFDLQDDITLWILKGLRIDLSPAEWNRIQYLDDTNNLEAWLAAANGVRHLIRATRQDVAIAKASYQEALGNDDNYISARRGLAWAAFLSVRGGWAEDPEAAILEAENQLGIVRRERPDEGTTKSLEGAIRLLQGKHDEAVEAGEFARKRLPGSADVAAILAHTLTYVGEHEEALKLIDDAMELSPMHPGFYNWVKGRALRMAKRFTASIEELEKDIDRGEPALVHLVELAASYSAAGRKEDARRIAQSIRSKAPGFTASAWLDHPPIVIPEIQSQEFEFLSNAGL